MTRIIQFTVSLVLSTFLLGCLPDPLEVTDIPALESKIVVSSQIVPNTGLVVFVSKSIGALDVGGGSNPADLINQIAIADAIVTISDGSSLDTLQALGSGLYGNIILDWQRDVDYVLTVSTIRLGRVEAVTRIPEFVPFDQVRSALVYNGFDSLAQISYRFTDPPGANQYMINVQRFSSAQDAISLVNPRIYTRLLDDKDFEGQEKEETFDVLFQEFSEGDSIAVSLTSISRPYYDFLKARSDSRFSFVEFAGEPINYPANVQGGYGFFNLHTPDIRFFVLE